MMLIWAMWAPFTYEEEKYVVDFKHLRKNAKNLVQSVYQHTKQHDLNLMAKTKDHINHEIQVQNLPRFQLYTARFLKIHKEEFRFLTAQLTKTTEQ